MYLPVLSTRRTLQAAPTVPAVSAGPTDAGTRTLRRAAYKHGTPLALCQQRLYSSSVHRRRIAQGRRRSSRTDSLGFRCSMANVNSSAPCPPEGCLEEIELQDLVKQNPVTMPMSASVFEALEMLVDNGISGVPFVDENGAVVGALSGYDLLALDSTPGSLDSSDGMFPKLGRCDEFNGRKKDMWSYFLETQERLEKAGGQTVGEIMHRATLVPPNTTLGDVADFIVQRKLARLCLVNEKNQCVGFVSRGDIMRATLRNYRWQKQRLAAQNSGLDAE